MEVCFLMVEKAPFGVSYDYYTSAVSVNWICSMELQFGLEKNRLFGSSYPGTKVTLLSGVSVYCISNGIEY